jgi:hypothetical protein
MSSSPPVNKQLLGHREKDISMKRGVREIDLE